MRPRGQFAVVLLALALAAPSAFAQVQRAQPGDSDQTLRAMRDEMDRSRERLRLGELERPYYIEYRLLDYDIRTITASFGALLSSSTTRNRIMGVDVRVGDYRVDSANFVSDDAFRGFIGSTGTVGIDRDYESLRQDLWLATDQGYKEALDNVARKRAFLRNMARPSDIDDFSREQPVVLIAPRLDADWTSRNWEDEARATSAVFRNFPDLYAARVTYHLIYLTQYLMTSEGAQVRSSRCIAAIEAAAETQADDGMRLHHFYTAYANRPAELPAAPAVRAELERVSKELVALRGSSPAPDYIGPVLFEAPAAGALLAQVLGPSVSGARPPLSMLPMFDQMMERLGGRSEWSGRLGTRVLPANITLVDDPTAKDFQGQPLVGSYEVDDEGVRAERVTLVENGTLRKLLMSRRPGQDFQQSNGHGRSTFLSDPRPAISNLFFQAADAQSPADLRKNFLDACKAAGRVWCLAVRRMDNPTLAIQRRQDSAEIFAGIASGAASGDRAPLLVYRVNAADGKEELVRGAWLTGLNLRGLRNIAGIGSDAAAFHFFQDPNILGTALSAFGTAQGGLPSSVVAPSLLLEEVEVRGARREPRRPPLVPPPPLS